MTLAVKVELNSNTTNQLFAAELEEPEIGISGKVLM